MKPGWWKYLLPVVVVPLATSINLALWPWLSQHSFAVFFAAVIITAWMGGFGPSLVTILLSIPVLDYYFVRGAGGAGTREFSFDLISIGRLATFAAVSTVMSVFALKRQRAEAALAEAGRQNAMVLKNVPGVVWETHIEPDQNGQRLNFVSDYVHEMLGYSVAEWLALPDFWLTIVHPDDRERAAREAAAIFAGGKHGISQFRWITKDGRELWVEAQSTALVDNAGRPIGLLGVTLDITARKSLEQAHLALLDLETQAKRRAERSAETTARLQQVTAKLSEAVTLDDVAAVITDIGLRAVSAKAGSVFMLSSDAKTLRILQSFGYSEETISKFQDMSLFAPLPATDCIRNQETIWLDNPETRVARYPNLAFIYEKAAALPLVSRGMVLGAIGLSFDAEVELDAELRSFISTLAQLCAQAMDRSLLFERERAARENAEKEQAQSALLAEVSRVLSTSLDYSVTLQSITKAMVPAFADWCSIELIDAKTLERNQVALAHTDPAKVAFARALREKYPPSPDSAHGIPNVLRTGKSEYMRAIPREVLIAAAVDDTHRDIILELDLRSYIVVPLYARGKILGALSLIFSDSGRHYDAEDLALAEEIGRRAATAIDNARLFDETQKAVASREEMLAIVSHDLKNPLAAIKLNASMLESRLPAAAEEKSGRVRAYVERISSSLVRANRLIEDLQNMVRLEAGNLAVSPRPENVTDLLQDALDILRTVAVPKGIEMNAQLDANERVLCDRERMGQVLSNLLSNAAKYTPPGGEVTVTAARRDNEVLFSVADTGPGIPADQHAHVFRKYWQAPNTAKMGTGLGLFITRGIVEAQGGKIWVESAAGQGAIFKFTIPLAKDPAPAIVPLPG